MVILQITFDLSYQLYKSTSQFRIQYARSGIPSFNCRRWALRHLHTISSAPLSRRYSNRRWWWNNNRAAMVVVPCELNAGGKSNYEASASCLDGPKS